MNIRSAVFAACAIAIVAPSASIAQVNFTGRSVKATINTSKADFSDAVLTLEATTFVEAVSPGSRTLSFRPLAGFVDGTYSTTGAVTLKDYVVTPSAGSAEVEASGSGSFTFRNTYATGMDNPNAPTTLIRYASALSAYPPFDNTALPLVEFFLSGLGTAGLVDDGGTFFFSLTIPGNYSSSGGLASTTGQYYEDPDFTYFSGFAVDRNYVYDSTTNTTTLSLFDPAVTSDDFVALDVYFFGEAAAVPEPGSWIMMLIGFGILGTMTRRRCVAASVASTRVSWSPPPRH